MLAEYVLQANGVVFGAKFNNDFTVVHDYCLELKDLFQFYTSKYSQSFIGDSFFQCKNFLNSGKLVMFSGTPCQINGLLSFLGKTYENLITVDFVCHGVPSPKLWNNYLNYRKKQINNFEIKDINFRDKSLSWEDFTLKINFMDGQTYSGKNDVDCYMNIFLNDIALNESCYNCNFKGIQRKSDFTLADFWGIDSVIKDFNDQKGTSLLFVHTNKAKFIFNSINQKCISKELSKEELDKAMAINSNAILSVKRPKERDLLAERLCSDSIFDNYNQNPKTTVGILNHVFSQDNYGALLVAYSMEKLVLEYGFTPITIYLNLDNRKSDIFQKFRKKYLHITKPMNQNDCFKLNVLADTFIVGSDQIWRNWWNNNDVFSLFFASFANYKKNIFSYAASFGIKEFPESEETKSIVRNLLSSFSAISVREESGLDILKKEFNLTGKWVLDPTLLIGKGYYEKILKDENVKIENDLFITSMIFPGESSDKLEYRQTINKISSKFNYKIINIFGNEKQISIPQWLYYISKSEFNIVDSFHGLIFSIIFHKNFVCISNSEGGDERFYSILKICNLEEKFILSDDISYEKIYEKLNIEIKWEIVEKKLNEYRIKSRDYLEKSLNKKISCNSKIIYNHLLERYERNLSVKIVLKILVQNQKKIIKLLIKKILYFIKKI